MWPMKNKVMSTTMTTERRNVPIVSAWIEREGNIDVPPNDRFNTTIDPNIVPFQLRSAYHNKLREDWWVVGTGRRREQEQEQGKEDEKE
ncbi:hypothetical protein PoB_004542700 [Plakobranchus ocellatus]|uniref:Uncharacterized protein n=1 Tax=Plakobranchus ocellatus TaxID=259542 RepID=A0AAV4BHT3_9GAST|nr:hypothetical protein PoB_004542700 [Plakobranchus ocellatus]